MREIKFRAWDLRNNRWLTHKESNSLFLNFEVTGTGVFHIHDNSPTGRDYFDLMQYIGLKDKHGKEGYFDDLVKWGKSLWQIIWDESHGKAMLQQISGSEIWPHLEIINLAQGEIVGNIYENKDLIESDAQL